MSQSSLDKVQWLTLDAESVLSALGSDPRSGLTTAELLKVKPHKWLLLAVAWECALIIALQVIPSTRAALGMVQPSTLDLAWIIGAAVVTATAIEVLKEFWKLPPMSKVD